MFSMVATDFGPSTSGVTALYRIKTSFCEFRIHTFFFSNRVNICVPYSQNHVNVTYDVHPDLCTIFWSLPYLKY